MRSGSGPEAARHSAQISTEQMKCREASRAETRGLAVCIAVLPDGPGGGEAAAAWAHLPDLARAWASPVTKSSDSSPCATKSSAGLSRGCSSDSRRPPSFPRTTTVRSSPSSKRSSKNADSKRLPETQRARPSDRGSLASYSLHSMATRFLSDHRAPEPEPQASDRTSVRATAYRWLPAILLVSGGRPRSNGGSALAARRVRLRR